MKFAPLILTLPAMLLCACGSEPGTSTRTATETAATMSRPDDRLPSGFPIYMGTGDGAKEVTVMEPPTGGKIMTFSSVARPMDVRNFYEERAVAAGMTICGRLDAADIVSVDATKPGGPPHSFGATATRKGEFTNVTLMFDVTP